MKPRATSGRESRSSTMAFVTPSGTSPPEAMMASTCLPSSVPRALWSRNMSPVEMWGICRSRDSSFACVPLPAPGGPSRMRIIVVSRIPGEEPSGAQAGGGATADARAAGSGEPLVVAGDEVPLDLLHGVEGHAYHDEERRPAEVEGHAELVDEDGRQDAHRRQVERAAEGDAREHVVDVLGGLLARTDAGDVAA